VNGENSGIYSDLNSDSYWGKFSIQFGKNTYYIPTYFSSSEVESFMISDFQTLQEEDIKYDIVYEHRNIIGILSLEKDKYVPTNFGINKKRAL
jgi:hypothetical protein